MTRQSHTLPWTGCLGKSPCLIAVMLLAVSLTTPGCSLFVMAGKMLTGDPTQTATFKQMTGVDLTKGKSRLLVICQTPDSVSSQNSSLRSDLSDGIARRLKREKIQVVDPDRVSTWIDDHLGEPADPQHLVQWFDCDYVCVIDIQEFDLREPNSEKLLRGNAHGHVRVFKVEQTPAGKLAGQVFATEFRITHPKHQPVSEIGRSLQVFQQEFRDNFCDEIARNFYDHGANTRL